MKYYYLNEQKEVQGPFTAAEMRRMMVEGVIDGHTLASMEGGSGWQQLALLDLTDEAAPSVPAAELGACPHCGTALVAAEVPAECPHCGKALHPGTEDLAQNAWYAFKQSFNYRGRATRREYWSFMLFSLIVQYGVPFILGGITGIMVNVDSLEGNNLHSPSAAIWVVMILSVLIQLTLLVSSLGVTVRRLHDTGHSGWWVAVTFCCMLSFPVSLALAGFADDTRMVMGTILILLILAVGCASLFIFILTLCASQRGPNKYGPSLLYPHG